MPPQAIDLSLFIIQEAIKNAPALFAEIQGIFAKPDPTPADWDALRARIKAIDYKKFVPASQLA